MEYLKMRPEQVREAVKRNAPVVFAAGAVEYHGPHLPLGTDVLIAETILGLVAKRTDCIVFPSLPFAPTMFWAGGPEQGEFDFEAEALRRYVKEMLSGIVKVGFRRIYILQHHQGSNGLPSLSIRQAAAEVVSELGQSWESGWGRRPYDQLPNPDIFSLIRVAEVDTFSTYASDTSERIPIGHAGKGETQLMMSEYAHTVAMEKLEALGASSDWPEWLQDAHEATKEEGDRWIEFCVQGWVEELSRKK